MKKSHFNIVPIDSEFSTFCLSTPRLCTLPMTKLGESRLRFLHKPHLTMLVPLALLLCQRNIQEFRSLM